MTATRRSSNRMAMDEDAALPSQGSDDRREDNDEEEKSQDLPKRRSPRARTASSASNADGSVAVESVGSTAGSGKRKRESEDSQQVTGTNQQAVLPNEAEPNKEGIRKSLRARASIPSVSYESDDTGASDLDTKPAAKRSTSSSNKRKSMNNQRVLQQVAPMDDMDTMIAEVEKEYAHLLECEEPLEATKDPLVTADQALFNRRWERLYQELLVFKKVYGHTIVPKMHMENRSLAVFVGNQRKYKKKRDKGEDSPMTDSRLKRLEAVGFVWDAKKHKDFWNIQANCDQAMELWEENFQMLQKYKEQIGDCLVPKVFPANQQLARWVGRQRQHYRFLREGKYSSLTEEKVKRLEDLGFVFDTRNRAMRRRNLYMRYAGRWDEYYNRLVEYREQHGNSSVPRRYKADQSLASWVQRQRHEFKLKRAGKYNHLTDYRMKKLEAVDFEFVKGPQKEIRGVEEDEIQDVFDVDEEALKQKRMLQGIRYESDSSDDSDASNPRPKKTRKSRKAVKEESEDEETETDIDEEEQFEDAEEDEEVEAEERVDEQEEEEEEEQEEQEEEDDDDNEQDKDDEKSSPKKGKTIGKAKNPGKNFKAKRVSPRSSKRSPPRAAAKVRQRPLPIRHRLLRGAAAASAEKAAKAKHVESDEEEEDEDKEEEEVASEAKAKMLGSKTSSSADPGDKKKGDEEKEEEEEDEQEEDEAKKDKIEEEKEEEQEEEEEEPKKGKMEETKKEEEEVATEGPVKETNSDAAKVKDAEEDKMETDESKPPPRQQVEENGNSAASLPKEESIEEEEVDDEMEEVEIPKEEIGPGVAVRASRKGTWQCSICSEDDFPSYVAAYVHEAHCSQFKAAGVLSI